MRTLGLQALLLLAISASYAIGQSQTEPNGEVEGKTLLDDSDVLEAQEQRRSDKGPGEQRSQELRPAAPQQSIAPYVPGETNPNGYRPRPVFMQPIGSTGRYQLSQDANRMLDTTNGTLYGLAGREWTVLARLPQQ